VESRFFQLEEMEDKDSCTTEIFLSTDGTVSVGETNGPLPLQAFGTWQQGGDDSFKMVITRKFGTGLKESKSSDVGEFYFEVVRTFCGVMANVGTTLAISGSMFLTVSHNGIKLKTFALCTDLTSYSMLTLSYLCYI